MPRPLILQYPLSLIFNLQMYLAMAVIGGIFLPLTLLNDQNAFRAVHAYCRWVRFSARWIVGLRSEVRGKVPEGEVLIASKHQSFLDIILIVSETPRPKFIMKKELLRAPILGWFALKIGCVPVDRGKRGRAIQQMLGDVRAGRAKGGQLIIYPQGTRVAPGAYLPYKIGTYVLYSELGQPCVPAATNVGVFWPRHGVLRKPGLAVVEFLDTIESGLESDAFMAQLETSVEEAADRLMLEAGFDASAARAATKG